MTEVARRAARWAARRLQTSPAMDAKNDSPAARIFWSYTRAFGELDARGVARHFHAPALMIVPVGIHALPDAAAVERHYQKIMSEMPKRYARTEFHSLHERPLSEGLSELSGTGTWIDGAGAPFMPFGFTYTLARTGDDWRIVVVVIHDANAAALAEPDQGGNADRVFGANVEEARDRRRRRPG